MKVIKIIVLTIFILFLICCLCIAVYFLKINMKGIYHSITEEDKKAVSVAESSQLSSDLIEQWKEWETQSDLQKGLRSDRPGSVHCNVDSWEDVKFIVQSPILPNPFQKCEEGQYFQKPENVFYMDLESAKRVSGEIDANGNRAGRISRISINFAYNIDGERMLYSVYLYDGSDDLSNYHESDIYIVNEEYDNCILENGLEIQILKRSRNIGNEWNYVGIIKFVKEGCTCIVNTTAKEDMETVDLILNKCMDILSKEEMN